MIDVGLVGFGFAGRVFHAPVIRCVSGLRLAGIVQRSGSDAADKYPEVRVCRTVDELLADDNIRLIVIATPNPSHFELAQQCLLAGRDVVIDKPFATTLHDALSLTKLAKEQGRLLSIYQNRRWDGDFITVRNLIGSNALGRLTLFESHFDRYRPELRPNAWRERNQPGSGVLFDLGVHLIDQAMLLFGVPEAVGADVRIERDGATVDDAFDVVLHYPNMRAVLRASMLACVPGPRFLLHGTRGSYVKYGLDPQEEALKLGQAPNGNGWGAERESMWGILWTAEGQDIRTRPIHTEAGDYRRYYENVRDAITGTAPLAVTPEQALNVLQALQLAQESSEAGRRIPWPKP